MKKFTNIYDKECNRLETLKAKKKIGCLGSGVCSTVVVALAVLSVWFHYCIVC